MKRWTVSECGVGRGKFRRRLLMEDGYGNGVHVQIFEAEVGPDNAQEIRELSDLAFLTRGLENISIDEPLTLCQLVAIFCDLGRVTDEPKLLFRWDKDPLFSPVISGLTAAFCTVQSREGKLYFFRHLLDLTDWSLKSTEIHDVKAGGEV